MSVFKAVQAGIEEGAKRIKAYHGSPHNFDKFSTENIGTGEGAQAYGKGMYFAESEGTAETYKTSGKTEGYMYEVNIDASPEELIDYSLPLNKQSKAVQEVVQEYKKGYGNELSLKERFGLPYEPTDEQVMRHTLSTPYTIRQFKDRGIKGVRYDDPQTRFSPKGKTNNYVIFDDKTIEIAKKYGVSMPVAGAILAGTMTPEQAQAGALSTGKRAIDSAFSKAMGGGTDRVGVLNKLESMQTGITDRPMGNIPEVNLYDFEGSPYILTQSDRSAAGGVLESIHNKEIDPVDLRGGRDFMFDPPSEGQVWASDPQVIKTMHNRSSALKKQFGKDPLLLPFTMAPTGIDFATMPLDTMINYARQGMSKSNIKKLDAGIRKIIPQWKGVADSSANAVFRQVHGSKRKLVEDLIDKNFRDVKGGLSMGEARAATSDSSQYLEKAGSLKNIGRINANEPPRLDSGHPTYVGGLGGEGLGVLRENLNARVFAENNGRVLKNDMSDIRSLGMRHQYSQGIIDDNLLKKIYDSKAVKGATAGSVVAGGTASADDISFEGALKEREARKGMSRQERMKNPPSPELRKLARSEVLPTLGTMAQGALSGAAETIDYLSPVNVARLFADPFNEGVGRFFAPSMTQNATQTVDGLTDPLLYDERDPEAEKRKESAMMVGSLFSPI